MIICTSAIGLSLPPNCPQLYISTISIATQLTPTVYNNTVLSCMSPEKIKSGSIRKNLTGSTGRKCQPKHHNLSVQMPTATEFQECCAAVQLPGLNGDTCQNVIWFKTTTTSGTCAPVFFYNVFLPSPQLLVTYTKCLDKKNTRKALTP